MPTTIEMLRSTTRHERDMAINRCLELEHRAEVAEAEVETLRALLRGQSGRVTRLVALLRDLQWSIALPDDISGDEENCPDCYHHRSEGHSQTCRIAALLGESEG